MILWLLLACRVATVVDACEDNPESCLTCDASADCVFHGNHCFDTVICGHEDLPLAFPMIGCDAALEYAWPDAAACACVDRVCTYVE